MKQGMTLENMALIDGKARKGGDGVYRFRGITYRVRNNRITHVAYGGKVFERCGYFNVEIGQYKVNYEDARKLLRTLQ